MKQQPARASPRSVLFQVAVLVSLVVQVVMIAVCAAALSEPMAVTPGTQTTQGS